MSETRKYESPGREQAKADTREKIVQAVIRVVLDDGIHAFTVQNVALKAGVSHRTLAPTGATEAGRQWLPGVPNEGE